MRKKLPGFSSEIKGARKIGWRERVPRGWYVVKEGTYYNHIKPLRNPYAYYVITKTGAKRLVRAKPKKKNPEGLFEAFHGSPPARIRKVLYEPPKKNEPLIKWGKISQINYAPEYPSKRRGTEFYHRFGDYGTMKFGKEQPILATNKTGTQLYIIKGKSKFKLTERGIVG